MASRNFSRKQALEKEVKEIYAKVSIGTSGAPTLQSGLGVTSVVRDAQGVYTITLNDRYMELLSVHAIQQVAAAEDLKIQVVSADVKATKQVKIRCIEVDTETDPSSGSVLLIKMDLKNTSVKP